MKVMIVVTSMKKVISILICLALLSCRVSEPETHLIPEGFTGRVIIFFNQKNGQQVEYENRARVYEIPSNGILKTQFPPNEGNIPLEDLNFYYLNKQGKRQKIKYIPLHQGSRRDSLNVVVYGVSVGCSNDSIFFKEYTVDVYSKGNEYKDLYHIGQYIDSKEQAPKENNPFLR